MECDEVYVGEPSRTFRERFMEYLKPPSPIYDHCNITGYITSPENSSIVGGNDFNIKYKPSKEMVFADQLIDSPPE